MQNRVYYLSTVYIVIEIHRRSLYFIKTGFDPFRNMYLPGMVVHSWEAQAGGSLSFSVRQGHPDLVYIATFMSRGATQ